jgi:hypothetical protein
MACAMSPLLTYSCMASVVQVKHIKGDRSDANLVKSLLEGKGFQVVYDINGELD